MDSNEKGYNKIDHRKPIGNSPSTGQTDLPRHWRALIENYLAKLLDISHCDFAAYVDKSTERERYVFATKNKPLPDLHWHSIIGHLTTKIRSDPRYLIITSEAIQHDETFKTLQRDLEPDIFDVILCIPLIYTGGLSGTIILFGNVPPVDVDLLRGSDRAQIENLTSLTACSLNGYAETNGTIDPGELHHAIIRKLPEGLLMTNQEGNVVEANDAFSALTGIPSDSLIGRSLKDNPILGTDCDQLVTRLLEEGHPFEIIASHKTGESIDNVLISPDEEKHAEKYLRLRGTIYPGETDQAKGMLLLIDDVTDDVMQKRETQRREHRHSRDIKLATRLQQNFFPPNYQKKRIRIATKLLPAQELAGDFFDIIELGPNTISLVIGDVVGKGIPSSLMAMNVHGMIANQAGTLTPPMKVLERVNEALYHQVKGEYWYATCFYAKIHVTQLKMTYARAGHELPLWWHMDTEEVTFLQGEGLPLGLFPDSDYATLQANLHEGDRLLFYTDGLTNAVNAAGERFGHDRLVDLFRKNCNLSSKNLLKVIENEIEKFHGNSELLDDIALALVSVVPDNWTTMAIPPYTFSEIIESILSELQMKGIDEEIIFKVRLSLDECVVNAFKHGHDKDERRAIIISYLIEPDKLILKVRDQGPGFDFAMIPDPTLEENLLQPGGRGVFLTLKMMDDVSFNDIGNEVTMIKYLYDT